jgi:DNA replicative helicase MCM subunit Mcm2 (Cdc46/Mcm family)
MNSHPVISSDAAFVLRKFFLELRQSYKKSSSNPITMRQLESLVRLTQVYILFPNLILQTSLQLVD